MFEILVAAAVTFLIVVELQVLFEREVNLRSVAAASGYMAILLLAAIVNWEFDIFEQKFASEFAFDVFKGRESLRDNSAFFLQAVIGAPAFFLTDVWWAAIGTNIATVSGVFYFVHKRSPVLSLIMLAPAVVNFSMFALRDPIIAVNAFVVSWLFLTPAQVGIWWKQASAVVLFAFIRPENMAIFAYAKLMTIFHQNNRAFLVYLFLPVFLGAALGVAALAPNLLGIKNSSVSDLPDTATEFYESRANRVDESNGGGSNILGGKLTSMPIYLRYPIQVFTFFVLPLPFEIRHLGLALAFVDSMLFCVVAYRTHKVASAKTLIIFWAYVLIVAFFSNNYGNVFRLRLPAYFILLAGLLRETGTELETEENYSQNYAQ